MADWIQSARDGCPGYTTRDESAIFELMHPDVHGNARQSLAEARVAPGQITRLHRHHQSEELYHIVSGSGRMEIDGEVRDVAVGDTVCIAPGSWHRIENVGAETLIILCCCSPPYSHDDTELAGESE
jgi:mannose-6-phosphate isomerase-like protein (cupin superfamily)